MKTNRLLLSALFLAGCVGVAYAAAGDSAVNGRLLVTAGKTYPTCATATGGEASGDLCVADDIEANDDLDIGDDAVIGGDAAITGALTAGSLNVTVLAGKLGEIRFCGNGPNATTATYIGPITETSIINATAGEQDPVDTTFGSSFCDGQDNTTEATADAVWHPSFAYKPVAMVCTSTCGTDDTMTLQLRDDAASVSGMTCNITLAGAAAQCSVVDATPETVAANSAIAVRVVNSTDDNCSAGDVECRVFITY